MGVSVDTSSCAWGLAVWSLYVLTWDCVGSCHALWILPTVQKKPGVYGVKLWSLNEPWEWAWEQVVLGRPEGPATKTATGSIQGLLGWSTAATTHHRRCRSVVLIVLCVNSCVENKLTMTFHLFLKVKIPSWTCRIPLSPHLGLARLASVRLCFHWLGYHVTVGGVDVVKWDNIILNIFFNFSQHSFAVQV